MDKKKGKPLDENYKKAKMSTLESLKNEMGGLMGDGLKSGVKKVEVVSPNSEGLAHGLDKAKELVEGSPEEESSESPGMEKSEEDKEPSDESSDSEETPEEETSELESMDLSLEDIDKIQKILDKKKAEKMMG